MDEKNKHSLPSEIELELLNRLDFRKHPSNVDRGYKFRNGYILLVGIYFVIRLLYFPDISGNILGTPVTSVDLAAYAQYRALYAIVMLSVYFASYINDWYFKEISLMIAASSFTVLIMDFFNVYSFVVGGLTPTLVTRIFVRAGMSYCFLMNALRDHRAPVMPRSIFS